MVQRGRIAVKLPLRYIDSSDDDAEANCQVIKHEQDVYQRLQQCDGVVTCLSLSGTSIHMELMEKGDLRAYLKEHRPAQSVQLSWFREWLMPWFAYTTAALSWQILPLATFFSTLTYLLNSAISLNPRFCLLIPTCGPLTTTVFQFIPTLANSEP